MLPAQTLPWAREVLGAGTMSVGEMGGGLSTSRVFRLELLDNRSVVLKQYAPDDRSGQSRVAREAQALAEVAGWVPVPAVLGVDDGELAGAPSLLMDFVPGVVDLRATDHVDVLAEALVRIHARPVPAQWATWTTWATPDKRRVPAWAGDEGLYREAFAVATSPPPPYDDALLHRDYRPANVLTAGGALTGVLDWAFACRGPAWLDVAHCRSELAALHGVEAAEHFAAAYLAAGGTPVDDMAAAHWQVHDLLGYLPDDRGLESGADAAAVEADWAFSGRADLTVRVARARREELLRVTLAILG